MDPNWTKNEKQAQKHLDWFKDFPIDVIRIHNSFHFRHDIEKRNLLCAKN